MRCGNVVVGSRQHYIVNYLTSVQIQKRISLFCYKPRNKNLFGDINVMHVVGWDSRATRALRLELYAGCRY